MRTSYVAIIVAVVIVAIGIIQVERPVSTPNVFASVPVTNHIPGRTPTLPWPKGVQADVEVPNVGSFGEQGPATAGPIGSITKMMTAYLVLKAHPLGAYAQGPSITMTAQDATLYKADAATQQSVMPVVAGEKISERKLLEGLLVPSGNNVATMLADWVGGNTTHFTAMMNQAAQSLGMTNTHYAGPSGLNPETVSTAANEVKLSEIMMNNPTFAEIVAMPQMTIGGNTVENYNYLIGHDGIIGVKTGSTLNSGGCVIIAGNRTVDSGTDVVYVGILGQQGTRTQSQLIMALNDSEALLNAVGHILGTYTVLHTNTVVGTINVPWQSSVHLVAAKSISLQGWPGLTYHAVMHLNPIKANAAMPAGTIVGSLTVKSGGKTYKVPVKTASALSKPSLTYRLERH